MSLLPTKPPTRPETAPQSGGTSLPLPGGAIVPAHELTPLAAGQPAESVAPTQPRHRPLPQARDVAYERIGKVDIDDLVSVSRDRYSHLEEAIQEVTGWVQGQLTDQGLSEDIKAARENPKARRKMLQLVDSLALQYITDRLGGFRHDGDLQFVMGSVENEVVGYGPIEPLLTDPSVDEVMVNGPHDVWIERHGKSMRVPGCRFRDNAHVSQIQQLILNPINRRVDQSNPLEDGRLPDGSRVNAVDGSIALCGPILTVRRFPATVWTIASLIDNGTVTEEMAIMIALAVRTRCNVLVAGATGSGKTSTLNALSSCIARDERVVTIEDSAELRLHPDGHVVGMEARPASASGKGAVTIRALVKNSLRMHPDRIIVGEVRDATALDMLQAMNTGHEGSMTTIHANSPEDACQRIVALVKEGSDLPVENIAYMAASALDLIVYQRRFKDGHRRMESISEVIGVEVVGGATRVKLQPLVVWEQTGVADDGTLEGGYKILAAMSEELVKLRGMEYTAAITVTDLREFSQIPEDTRPRILQRADDDDDLIEEAS